LLRELSFGVSRSWCASGSVRSRPAACPFPGGGYCCPDCGEPFTLLGTYLSGEQLDWQVTTMVRGNCQRRYKREGGCRGPVTVMAPGRRRRSGRAHADETTWRVFCPGRERARHAELDEKTGQLLPAADGGPRRLVISSDFYAVYQSAGTSRDQEERRRFP
jgi:hypothetical protein